MPQIICVGYKKTLRYSTWEERDGGYFPALNYNFQHPMAFKKGKVEKM